MAHEILETNLTGDYVDRRTWLRMKGPLVQLAIARAQPYMLSDSPLWVDGEALPEDEREVVQDTQLGQSSTYGDLVSGKYRFVLFNPEAEETLVANGESSLRGRIDFSKQNNSTYFYGTFGMYEYVDEAAVIMGEIHGYAANPDKELGFEFNRFAQSIGLGRLWRMTFAEAGDPFEKRFAGKIDTADSWAIAQALIDFKPPPEQ